MPLSEVSSEYSLTGLVCAPYRGFYTHYLNRAQVEGEDHVPDADNIENMPETSYIYEEDPILTTDQIKEVLQWIKDQVVSFTVESTLTIQCAMILTHKLRSCFYTRRSRRQSSVGKIRTPVASESRFQLAQKERLNRTFCVTPNVTKVTAIRVLFSASNTARRGGATMDFTVVSSLNRMGVVRAIHVSLAFD